MDIYAIIYCSKTLSRQSTVQVLYMLSLFAILVAHGFVDVYEVVQLGDSRLALAFSKLWAQLALGGGARSGYEWCFRVDSINIS